MAVRFQKGLPNYTEKLCGGRKCLLSQRQLERDNRLTWRGRACKHPPAASLFSPAFGA